MLQTIGQIQRKISELYPEQYGILTHCLGLVKNGEYSINPEYNYLSPYLVNADIALKFENDTQKMLRCFWWEDVNYFEGGKLTELSEAVRLAIDAHEYELKTLIATTQFEYNPIDNVSEDTLETYRNKGDEKGDEKRTLNYDTYTSNTNENLGERTDNSSTTNNNTYGKTSGGGSTNEGVSPSDSSTYNPLNQTTENHHEDSRTDNLSSTGNVTQGKQENKTTTTVNAHQDKDNLDINMVTTTSYSKHIVRHGNIGVTSSQQLIESERNIAHFSIVEEIRRIVADYILIRVYN